MSFQQPICYLVPWVNLRDVTNRGYYTAAWRYKISLPVLKKISRVSAANKWNIFSTREEKFRISKRPCNVLFIIKNTNEIQNHFTLIVFWCERRDLLWSHSNGDIFTCEDNMLFSHVKISSFRAKAHLVFHWCLYNNKGYYHMPQAPSFLTTFTLGVVPW